MIEWADIEQGVTRLSLLPVDHPRRLYCEALLNANVRSKSEYLPTAWFALGLAAGLRWGWRELGLPVVFLQLRPVYQYPMFYSGFLRGRTQAAALLRELRDRWQGQPV
jgi:hypothetical protein